eukprot:3488451-Amphidinium_carterae.1
MSLQHGLAGSSDIKLRDFIKDQVNGVAPSPQADQSQGIKTKCSTPQLFPPTIARRRWKKHVEETRHQV